MHCFVLSECNIRSGLTDVTAMYVYIYKDSEIELDGDLLNTQRYKVGIKGKGEQPRERSIAVPYMLV